MKDELPSFSSKPVLCKYTYLTHAADYYSIISNGVA